MNENKTDNQINNYITLSEASRLSGISRDYLNVLIRRGKLRAVKEGNNWLTTKEWFAECRAPREINNNKTNGKYLSLFNAAKMAGVSAGYLNVAVRRGKLRATKLGRNWFTTNEWLSEYKTPVGKLEQEEKTELASLREALLTEKEKNTRTFKDEEVSRKISALVASQEIQLPSRKLEPDEKSKILESAKERIRTFDSHQFQSASKKLGISKSLKSWSLTKLSVASGLTALFLIVSLGMATGILNFSPFGGSPAGVKIFQANIFSSVFKNFPNDIPQFSDWLASGINKSLSIFKSSSPDLAIDKLESGESKIAVIDDQPLNSINSLTQAEALDSFAAEDVGSSVSNIGGAAGSQTISISGSNFTLFDDRLSLVETNLQEQTDLINSELSLQKKTILGVIEAMFGITALVPRHPISTIVVQGQPATLTTYSVAPQTQTGFDRLSANYFNLSSNAVINGTLTVKSGANVNTLSVSDTASIIGNTTIGGTLSVAGNTSLGNLTASGNSVFNNSSTTNSTLTNFWSTNGTIINASTTYLTVGDSFIGSGGLFSSAIQTPLIWNNGTLTASTTGANPIIFATNSSERMRIDENGNVGIGTTTPGSLLSVHSSGGTYLGGNLTVSGTSTFANLSTFNNASTTNGTITNLWATNGTITNASTTYLTVGSNFWGGGGLTSNTIQTPLIWNNGTLTASTTGANPIIFATNDSERMRLNANGNILIATTTIPSGYGINIATSTFTYGNQFISGGLGIGIATTTNGVLQTSGDASIGGNLYVSGNSTVIGASSANTLTVNSSINSDLIPDQNVIRDLGSTSYYWDNAYISTLTVNSISAASTSIGGTQSATFTINSDNTTADNENETLIFFRGTVVPNALLTWNSATSSKRFEFNQALYINNGSASTTNPTLTVQTIANQTASGLQVIDNNSNSIFSVNPSGNKTTMVNASTTYATIPTFWGTTGTITSASSTNLTGTNFWSTSGTITNASSTYATLPTFWSSNANITGGTIIGITDLAVADGGTGASTLTDHGVLVGSGTDAITPLTVGTNGQLLVGSTGADPVFATLNCANGLTCTTGAGTLQVDFDGGDSPGGSLGGTWVSPTIDDLFILNTGDEGTGTYTFPELNFTNATGTRLFATNGTITNASTTYTTLPTFWGTTGNVTNLTITNASTTYATVSDTAWINKGIITNASTTYATLPTFWATTGTIDRANITNASTSALTINFSTAQSTSTTPFNVYTSTSSVFSIAPSGLVTIPNFTSTTGVIASASSTNLTATNFWSTTGNITNGTITNASSTYQTISDTAWLNNLVSTNATTTTFRASGLATFGGNVGIGTTNPNYKLEVNGTSGFTGNMVFTADNSYDIGASGATRPRTGYFGTGISAPNVYATGLTSGYLPYAAATTKLLTNSPIYTNGTTVQIGATTGTATFNVEGVQDTTSYIIARFAGTNDYEGGFLQFTVPSVGHMAFGVLPTTADFALFKDRYTDVAGTELLRIQKSSGNVGIGTTAPGQKLHVEGQCVTGDALLQQVEEISNLKSQISNQQLKTKNLKIEDVKGGEYVLSLNEETGKIVPAKIKGLLDMGVKPIYKITTDDGKTIRTTGNHPYLTKNGWQKVTELDEGAEIAVVVKNNSALLFAQSQKQNEKSDSQQDNYDNFKNSIDIHGLFSFANQINNNGSGDGQQAADGVEYKESGVNVIGVHSYSSVTNKLNDQKASDRNKPDTAMGQFTISSISEPITNEAKNTWPMSRNISDNVSSLSEDKPIDINSDYNYTNPKTDVKFVKIAKIELLPAEQVYDIEVEGTHNFVANGIIAHNTYISGNVGIGNISPAEKLNVQGTISGQNFTATSTSLYSTFPNASTTYATIPTFWGTTGNVANLTATNASTTHLTVANSAWFPGSGVWNSSGNVGIGTTGPGDILDVWAGTNAYKGITISASTGRPQLTISSPVSGEEIGVSWSNPGQGWRMGTNYTNSDNNLQIRDISNNRTLAVFGGSGKVGLGGIITNATTLAGVGMVVTTDGNVGIGTPTPGQLLTVGAGSVGKVDIAGNSAGISLTRYDTADPYLQFVLNGGQTYTLGIDNSVNDVFGIWGDGSIGNNPRLIIDTSGNVGIGTSTVGSRLVIQGSGATSATKALSIFNSASTEMVTVLNNGNVGIGTTTPGSLLSVHSSGATYLGGNLTVSGTSTFANLSTFNNASTTNGTITNLWSTNGTITNASTTHLSVATTANFPSGIWNSSGNVGIGTTNPSQKLHIVGTGPDLSTNLPNIGLVHVSGAAGFQSIGFRRDADTNGGWLIGTSQVAVGDFSILQNQGASTAISRMYISTTGNVGIGTTTPGQLLSVNGNGYFAGNLTIATTTYMLNASTTYATIPTFWSSSANITGGTITGITDLAVADGGTGASTLTGFVFGNGASAMTATTTPYFVNGIYMAATSTMNGYNICTSANGVCATGASLTGTTGQVAYFSGTNTAVGTSTLFISTAGNVGIGTTAPINKFNVKLATNMNMVVRNTTDGSGTHPDIFSVNDANTAYQTLSLNGSSVLFNQDSGGNVGIGTTDPGTYKLYVNGTGYLATGGAWVYGSDARMKENISYLDSVSGLEKILQLKPSRFDYIDGIKNNLGFIAQDVQSVIPEAVVVTNETTGMLGLKIEFIIPYLVNAVQELNAKIASSTMATSTLQASQGTIDLTTLNADLNLNGFSMLNVKSIAGVNNLWSIDSEGNIIAKSVQTQALTVGGGAASGVTVYDRQTASPKCIYIEGGVIKTSGGACGSTVNTGTVAPISETIPSPAATSSLPVPQAGVSEINTATSTPSVAPISETIPDAATSTPEIIIPTATSTQP